MDQRPLVIDADGHILERQEDVRKYLKPPWKQRATSLWPSGQPWDPELFGRLKFKYSHDLSPAEQVKIWLDVMDQHGMETAVCFATGGQNIERLQEPAFSVAVARAFNDHVANEYNSRTNRIKAVGLLPLGNPGEARLEMRRAVNELGLICFQLLSQGNLFPLGDPFYDPIYEEAASLGCALALHPGRGVPDEVGAGRVRTFSEIHTYVMPASMLLHFTSIIYNGVPVRFPGLRLAFLEMGCTWIPYWLDRMDEHWEKRGEIEMPYLQKKPSQIIKDLPIYFTPESGETLLPEAIAYLGDDHFMYSSDFPHWDGEFPENLESLWNHPSLSLETKRKILRENAVNFFQLGIERR